MDLQLLTPHGGFLFAGTQPGLPEPWEWCWGGLEANGFSSPSAPPFPLRPIVLFGVGTEVGGSPQGRGARTCRKYLGGDGWTSMGQAGLRCRSRKVGAGRIYLGAEPEISKCILLHSGVIDLLLKIPVQQDMGRSERVAVVLTSVF